MSPGRYQGIKQLFDRVVGLPPAERSGALDRLAGGNIDLREQSGRFLASNRARSFVPRVVKESLIGRRIGRCEVWSEIGRGGGARSIPPPAPTISSASWRRSSLRRERQILANLEHPSISSCWMTAQPQTLVWLWS